MTQETMTEEAVKEKQEREKLLKEAELLGLKVEWHDGWWHVLQKTGTSLSSLSMLLAGYGDGMKVGRQQVACKACKGTGLIDGEKCELCSGLGRVHPLPSDEPPPTMKQIRDALKRAMLRATKRAGRKYSNNNDLVAVKELASAIGAIGGQFDD